MPRLSAASIARMGFVSASDLEARGITRTQMRELISSGVITRHARGIYASRDHGTTENYSRAIVAKHAPHAVMSLLTALSMHGIGTQLPRDVWITIDGKSRAPRLDYPNLRIMRASGQALRAGVEVHKCEGVDVRVYSAAKTVVDCFKYRNKVGLDVALEAMWEGWRYRKYRMDEVERFGRICRVDRVMAPYLAAMLAQP